MALPTAPFDPANSIFNGLSIIQLKIGTSTLVYEATKLDDDPENEVKILPRPNLKGVIYAARRVRIKGADKFIFDLDEVKRLLEIFDGKLHGSVPAKATMWIPDVDDASNVCALKSQDDFNCTVSRDGKLGHGNSDFSKTSIKIDSDEDDDITWTKDAVVGSGS